MDKKLAIKLNGNRHITGTLRGFDQFMNLVLDDTEEQVSASEKNELGMVVIRGNSVVTIEGLEKLWDYVPPPNR
ncbi:probable small nuclear ribonucleoprotein G, partial [Seriola lalandi dorsalis]|uniref:Small nuclear ribonucleoprotein G n=2 Tax=Eukaryota TaxID=2759 RepID=A0A3B4WXG6_SERLL